MSSSETEHTRWYLIGVGWLQHGMSVAICFEQIQFWTILHTSTKFKDLFFAFLTSGPKWHNVPNLRTIGAFYSMYLHMSTILFVVVSHHWYRTLFVFSLRLHLSFLAMTIMTSQRIQNDFCSSTCSFIIFIW